MRGRRLIMQVAYLTLNTGDVLKGKFLNEVTETEGEVVFNTSMIGYQEVLTNPAYAGQFVTLTYPLVGNIDGSVKGKYTDASGARALIVQTLNQDPDDPKAEPSFKKYTEMLGIPVIYDLDTRHLTKIIRTNGPVFGKISSQPNEVVTMTKPDSNLVKQVSTNEMKRYQAPVESDITMAVIDFGQTASLVEALLELNVHVLVCPYNTSKEQLERYSIDGVFFSNGPGDPSDSLSFLPNIKAIANQYPVFGINLGHQLLALSYGMKTKKLKVGHRGGNVPVKSTETTNVYMTSQNHGYVVCNNSVTDDFIIHFTNVNDQSVEGLKHKSKPIISVQFHPEGRPGPRDTEYLIQEFVSEVAKKGATIHA